MHEHGIQGVTRRKRRSLTRPDTKARPAPHLSGRDFDAETPGTKLVGERHHRPAHRRGLALPRLLARPGHPRGRRLLDGRSPPRRSRHRRTRHGPRPRWTATRLRDPQRPRQRIHLVSFSRSDTGVGSSSELRPHRDLVSATPRRRVSAPCSKKRSAPASGPTGPPPEPTSSTSSRRSTTAADCADTRSWATSPRPRPANGTDTPSRHNHQVPKITGKLQGTAAHR